MGRGRSRNPHYYKPDPLSSIPTYEDEDEDGEDTVIEVSIEAIANFEQHDGKERNITNKNDTVEPSPRRRKRALLCVGLVVLAVLVLIIGLSVGLTNKNGRHDAAATSAIVVSSGDEPGAPTRSPDDVMAYLLEILRQYSPEEILLDDSIPQGQAFLALRNVEEASASALPTPSFDVVQRYSLLTLHYSTTPTGWTTAWDPMESTCTWNGVDECSDSGEVTSINLGTSTHTYTRQLSIFLRCILVVGAESLTCMSLFYAKSIHQSRWDDPIRDVFTQSVTNQSELGKQSNRRDDSGLHPPIHKDRDYSLEFQCLGRDHANYGILAQNCRGRFERQSICGRFGVHVCPNAIVGIPGDPFVGQQYVYRNRPPFDQCPTEAETRGFERECLVGTSHILPARSGSGLRRSCLYLLLDMPRLKGEPTLLAFML